MDLNRIPQGRLVKFGSNCNSMVDMVIGLNVCFSHRPQFGGGGGGEDFSAVTLVVSLNWAPIKSNRNQKNYDLQGTLVELYFNCMIMESFLNR